MPPKRIAFDARYINDRYQGIGRYAFNLLKSLARLAPEITFVVFKGQDRDTRFNWEQVTCLPNVEVRQGPWPLYLPQEQLKWPRLLSGAHIDLFHSPYIIAPLLSNVPAMITVHDLIFDRYPEYMPSAWSRPYYRLMMQFSTRHARKVICVSEATAKDLVEFYGTSRSKVSVVMEGVDAQFGGSLSQAEARGLCERYKLSLPFILSVGARRPHKNLGILVQAFSNLQNTLPHSLVFIGPPDKRFPDQAVLLVNRLKLEGRARFLDWVPESDLPGLYSLADLVVLPSTIEGFGLPALEAMASGTPVIAADRSSFPEVVGSGGLLVGVEDLDGLEMAMRNISTNPDLHTKYAQAGIRQARSFTWERSAAGVLELYGSG